MQQESTKHKLVTNMHIRGKMVSVVMKLQIILTTMLACVKEIQPHC